MAQGLQPISGKNIDGGLRYVFKRSEVECLDLASLLAVSKAQSISRYKERSIVDVDQAAYLLGISRKELVNLVERGILKLHNRLNVKGYIDDPYFLSLYTIEKYKARLITYADLVSAQVAAVMLKVSQNKLYANYIRGGKLKVALREGKRGDYYFKQKDVKALANAVEKLEKQTMRSPEAAKILSVDPTTIHKWTIKGILRPVSGPHVDGSGWNLYLRRDVERLKAERIAFKGKCEKQGKTSHYGRPDSKMSLSV
jgi:predicted site-specific integrase-resolvase